MKEGQEVTTPLGTGSVQSIKDQKVKVSFSTPIFAEDANGYWDFVKVATFDRSQCRLLFDPDAKQGELFMDFRDSPGGADKINLNK